MLKSTNDNALTFMQSLPVKEKADLFDKIAEMYYDSNFGQSSKSQIELLMFSVYLDKMIDL